MSKSCFERVAGGVIAIMALAVNGLGRANPKRKRVGATGTSPVIREVRMVSAQSESIVKAMKSGGTAGKLIQLLSQQMLG